MKKWRRNLPHIETEDSVYFITFRSESIIFTKEERLIIMEHLRGGDDKFYSLFSALVMPDHVHIVLQPNRGVELSRIMKGIKGASAKKINSARGANGIVWQEEYWDRTIRDDKEFEDTINYIYLNPLRKELVKNIEDWDAWYCKLW